MPHTDEIMLNIAYKKDTFASPCALVLGCFDGVHRGHGSLIRRAKDSGLPVGLMLLEGKDRDSLFTREERAFVAEKMGVDFCFWVTLDEETAHTPAELFLRRIVEKINVKLFVCGEDFRFGDGANGTPETIKGFGELACLPLLTDRGEKIASSRIKELVARGEVERANELLEVPFFVTGTVRHGRGVGHTYGFPTANIDYPQGKCKLGMGVYAVTVGAHRGIANYGGRPTFREENPVLEVYIDGFEGDLYGKKVRVEFDRKIRDIRKFASKEELKEQLERDIRTVR